MPAIAIVAERTLVSSTALPTSAFALRNRSTPRSAGADGDM